MEQQTRVFLLGRFAVERDGSEIPRTAWKRRRPVELLTQLALASGHLLHREELIDRLWPDKDLDAGANNLYRTLHELRRIGGDDLVSVDRGVVQLSDAVWVDVTAFERAVSSGDPDSLATAITLYRGELLPDDPYSDQLQARRESLRQRFVDAALQLARESDDPTRSIEVLRRAVEVDPTLEEAHRLLMTALARSGRPKDALRQYSECVTALRSVLDTEPSAETDALRDRIQQGDLRPAAAPASDGVAPAAGWRHIAARLLGSEEPPTVHGRGAVSDILDQFADEQGGALLLIGEAGVGKTRLAVEAARRCADSGAVVLSGMGYDFDRPAPYTVFVDAWSDYQRLQGLPVEDNPFASFRPIPGASAQEDRMRLFQLVERSLAELAGDGRVCLLLEDLHQADESSLFLFHHLARASRHLPIKLIGTLREENVVAGSPLRKLMDGLTRERLGVRVPLDRLDREATAALVADRGGAELSAAAVDSLYRLAEGNPFFTEELLQSMLASGATEPVVSHDLLDTIRGRVVSLGRDTERFLVAAAVHGIRFHFEVVRAALGIDGGDALDALDRGLEAHIIEEHDDPCLYRFRHALMRQALYDSLSHARRVFLHRAIADSLEAHPSGAEREEMLAYHHEAAGQIDRALPHLRTATERAMARLGFGEAVDYCARALVLMDDLGTEDGPERLWLLKSLGGMQVALGDLDHAIENLLAAEALHRPRDGWRPSGTQRANALRLAALAHIERGELSQAEAVLDRAQAQLEDDDDSAERGNVYYLYSQLRWHQSRHEEAFELAERCLQEAERRDDPEAIAKGYEMLALACHSLGDWKRGSDFEQRRSSMADAPLDVASAFDIHL